MFAGAVVGAAVVGASVAETGPATATAVRTRRKLREMFFIVGEVRGGGGIVWMKWCGRVANITTVGPLYGP